MDTLKRPSLAQIAALNGFHGGSGLKGFAGREDGGFITRSDVTAVVPGTDRTIDGQPINEIWQNLVERNAVFNQHANVLISLLTFPVERAQEKVSVYDSAAFEEATEFGRPGKVRMRMIPRGFPLKHYDLGYGYTQEFIDSARGNQITAVASKVESAWWARQMDIVLTALFTEDNATDEDGISVKRLYNGDGEVPPNYRRWTHDGNHTHYLYTAGTSIALADIAALEEHLIHHGYGDNGETLVLHVHRDDLVAVRALAGFVPAASATVPTIVDGNVVGVQRSAPQGLTPEGYIGEFVVVQNNEIPSGYLLAYATGGTFADENVVGLRQHENPAIRGLRLVEGPNGRYPLIDAVYDGYLGAGIRHRGAAAILYVDTGGGGAYVEPTL